eukprot:11785170-Alexandrium_andersonii.AAC.1
MLTGLLAIQAEPKPATQARGRDEPVVVGDGCCHLPGALDARAVLEPQHLPLGPLAHEALGVAEEAVLEEDT